MSRNLTTRRNIVEYLKGHKASLGVLLAAYGAFFLASVIMGGWTPFDWGKDVFDFPQSAIYTLMPRSYISAIFFVTAFPSLLIGTALLCSYTIGVLRSGITADSEHVAILLTFFGFAYQVVGAWPLGNAVDFPWEWQKQIMSYGSFFVWLFYLLSLFVLGVGAVSLYVHSREYHRKHPQLSIPL
jgi:hypothetical protein